MYFFTVLTLLSLASCAPADLTKRAPIFKPSTGQLIPNKYIVKLKDSALEDELYAAVSTLSDIEKVSYIYNGGRFKGFALELDDKSLSDLQQHRSVSDAISMVPYFYYAVKHDDAELYHRLSGSNRMLRLASTPTSLRLVLH